MTENERTENEASANEAPEDGPDITEPEDDPAYNPSDEELKEIKGG